MTALLAFVLGGLGTYLMRASFVGFIGDGALPPAIERSLRYVAPAVFAAIVGPRVLGDEGFGALAQRPTPEIIAALIAGVIVARTRNIPLTLVSGMVVLWLLQWAGL